MAKDQIIELECAALITDCGDGSFKAAIFNDLKELLDNETADIEDPTEREEKRHEIEIEDDPYENGYIDKSVRIKLSLTVDGSLRLLEPIHVSGG